MHQARLEIKEGFAPERMLLTHQFKVFVPITERTQIDALKSPEQKLPQHLALERLDKHSDVWSAACLFKMIYEATGIAKGLRAQLEIPTDVQEVLDRSLARDSNLRFHSVSPDKLGPNELDLSRGLSRRSSQV